MQCPFLPKNVYVVPIYSTINYTLFLFFQVSCVLVQQHEYNGQFRNTNTAFFSEIKKTAHVFGEQVILNVRLKF